MTSESAHDELPFEESELPLVLAGRYELGETLGLGGSGEVRRAWDRRLQRAVAVKLFAPGVHGPDRRRQGQELQTLARLSHPGLVELHDAGRDGGRGFLVMRLVDGPSLAELVARGPLPPLTVAGLGAQLADALAYVHAVGVTHRDLKPDNVLLDEQGRPLLADFGIALLVDSTRVTVAGGVVGTAAYMAPEQVRGEPVGPAADVYALGLVLLEALRGEREFPGTTHETVLARLHRAPRVPDDLPGDLTAVLRAMTASDPTERLTAATIATRLRAAVLELEPATEPIDTVLATLAGRASGSVRAVATAEPDPGPPTAPSALDALFAESDPQPVSARPLSAVVGSTGVPTPARRRRLAVAASVVGVLAATGVGAAAFGLGAGSTTAVATASPQAATVVPAPAPPMSAVSPVGAAVAGAQPVAGGLAPTSTDQPATAAARASGRGSGAGGLPGALPRPARAAAGSAAGPTRSTQPTADTPSRSTPTRSTEDRAPRPSRGDQVPSTTASSGASAGPHDDGGSSSPQPSPRHPSAGGGDDGGGDGSSRDQGGDSSGGGGAGSGRED